MEEIKKKEWKTEADQIVEEGLSEYIFRDCQRIEDFGDTAINCSRKSEFKNEINCFSFLLTIGLSSWRTRKWKY